MEDYRLQQSGQEVQNILDGAAMQTDLTAETERAELAEQTLQGHIDDEALARQTADGMLQGHIDNEETRAKAAEKQNADDIDAIEEKLPAGASSSNKLATEEYVDDKVATASATFRGTYNLVSDFHLTPSATHLEIAGALLNAISTADNNDYAFVQIPTSVDTPTEIASIERYKFNGTAWAYEYTLNNSGFTSAQWAAINSGITSGLVTKLGALPTADELAAALLAKQNVLTWDTAPTPSSTNPVTSGGIHTAIDNEKTARQNSDAALQQAIEAILLLIPSAASALNQLADKAFVNSSVATATATFRGTYNLVSDLHLTVDATHADIAAALLSAISTADNNDYAFVQVPTSVDTPTEIRVTERYKFDGTSWAYEYDLNNSGFTAAQWAAINSGITQLLVTKLGALPTNAELTTALAGKQNVLTFDTTPTSGSTNPVTSGGIFSALAGKQDTLTFDNTPTEGSNNPVKSGGIYTAIALVQAAVDALTGRMTDAEGDIATNAGNIATNTADIALLQDLYEALTQSALVVVAPTDTWPVANPATKTIYRVVDRVNTPPQNYSDYMWNGTSMVLMATYNNAIDDVPTAGSDNLVKSGGVFKNLNFSTGSEKDNCVLTNTKEGVQIDSEGNEVANPGMVVDTFLITHPELFVHIKTRMGAGGHIAFYDKSGTAVKILTYDGEKEEGIDTDTVLLIPYNAKYFKVSRSASLSSGYFVEGKNNYDVSWYGDYKVLENVSPVSVCSNSALRLDGVFTGNNDFKCYQFDVTSLRGHDVTFSLRQGSNLAAAAWFDDNVALLSVIQGVLNQGEYTHAYKVTVPVNAKYLVLCNVTDVEYKLSAYDTIEKKVDALKQSQTKIYYFRNTDSEGILNSHRGMSNVIDTSLFNTSEIKGQLSIKDANLSYWEGDTENVDVSGAYISATVDHQDGTFTVLPSKRYIILYAYNNGIDLTGLNAEVEGYMKIQTKTEEIFKDRTCFILPLAGQSLAIGSESYPAISTENKYQNCYMMLQDESSVRPLIENKVVNTYGIRSIEEHPLSGLCYHFVEYIKANYNIDIESDDFKENVIIIGVLGGAGGITIEQFVNSYFDTWVNHIGIAREYAYEHGYNNIVIPGWGWVQGENDARIENPTVPYKQKLLSLQSSFISAMADLSIVHNYIPCACYQTASMASYGQEDVPTDYNASIYNKWMLSKSPTAQCEVIAENKNFIAGNPVYVEDVNSYTNVHLTADGTYLMACYIAQSICESYFLKYRNKGVTLANVRVMDDNKIEAIFNAGVYPIVENKVQCAPIDNLGFTCWNESSEDIIESVELVYNKAIIQCSESPLNAKLRLGWTPYTGRSGRYYGWRTNICDSRIAVANINSIMRVAMPNFAYMFERLISKVNAEYVLINTSNEKLLSPSGEEFESSSDGSLYFSVWEFEIYNAKYITFEVRNNASESYVSAAFYDAGKNFISNTLGMYSASGKQAYKNRLIPDNAVYIKLCGTTEMGYSITVSKDLLPN